MRTDSTRIDAEAASTVARWLTEHVIDGKVEVRGWTPPIVTRVEVASGIIRMGVVSADLGLHSECIESARVSDGGAELVIGLGDRAITFVDLNVCSF